MGGDFIIHSPLIGGYHVYVFDESLILYCGMRIICDVVVICDSYTYNMKYY